MAEPAKRRWWRKWGALVTIIIIGAVALLGYSQFAVVGANAATTTATLPSVHCPSSACVNVTIPSGASSPPAGYKGNQTTTYGYSPDTVTVVIGKNNTLFWVNDDVAPHTVTSDAGDPASFDSSTSGPLTKQGGTYQFTFTVPGTYYYHCSFHAWMQGTVIVLAASSSSTGGGGIPEFPYQLLAVVAVTILVVFSYLAVRRPWMSKTGAHISLPSSNPLPLWTLSMCLESCSAFSNFEPQ